MINATKKWIYLKISGATLVPLMIWFILNFITIYDQDFLIIINFFSNPVSKFLFSLFIINAYFFSSLSISEVFEDYIKNNKIKNVANRFLYISSVVIPLITIILLFKL
jgi:succinate dehydrogenase / fumarate reductase membrane anchor subunit